MKDTEVTMPSTRMHLQRYRVRGPGGEKHEASSVAEAEEWARETYPPGTHVRIVPMIDGLPHESASWELTIGPRRERPARTA